MNALFGEPETHPGHDLDEWPLLCGACGHRFGGVYRGKPFYFRDGLRRIYPDAPDGLPRYGLRRGAFLGFGKVVRRSLLAGLGASMGKNRPYRHPQEPPGRAPEPRFYAYCVNCSARNFVDTTLLQPSE
jgi:hypothetical protein